MRLRLRVLGVTVVSITFDADDTQSEESGIGGGSGHNFERFVEFGYEEADTRDEFGFQ